MNKLAWELPRVQVEESVAHEPLALLYDGKWRRVVCVLCRWRVAQEWWKRPVERDYFRVSLEGGFICEVFCDVVQGCWRLQRVYD